MLDYTGRSQEDFLVYDAKHIMGHDAESMETIVVALKRCVARNSNCLELNQYI